MSVKIVDTSAGRSHHSIVEGLLRARHLRVSYHVANICDVGGYCHSSTVCISTTGTIYIGL